MSRRLTVAAVTLAAAFALVLTGCNDDGANVRPGGGSGSGADSGSGTDDDSGGE